MIGTPRTANSVEAWQGQHELVIEQLKRGMNPSKQRAQYDQLNLRLFRVAEKYDLTDPIGYLRNIAKNLEKNI